MSRQILVPLILPADPAAAFEAATKQYVDARDVLNVLKAGDTMTGTLTLQNPTTGTDLLKIVSDAGRTWNLIAWYRPDGTTRQANITTNITTNSLKLTADMNEIEFATGGVTVGRWDTGGLFLVGKTAAGISNAGIQLPPNASIGSTTSTDVANYIANAISAAVVVGHDYFSARDNNGTRGSIRATAGGVAFNTTSDYRLKDSRGRITEARERIRVLKPRRVVWHEDPTQTEVDGFFAHEVSPVVPDAVTGEKDGEQMQLLDATRMIPLLTAALQEAHDRIDVLEARLTALEAA
jgi:hypothetical protein